MRYACKASVCVSRFYHNFYWIQIQYQDLSAPIAGSSEIIIFIILNKNIIATIEYTGIQTIFIIFSHFMYEWLMNDESSKSFIRTTNGIRFAFSLFFAQ